MMSKKKKKKGDYNLPYKTLPSSPSLSLNSENKPHTTDLRLSSNKAETVMSCDIPGFRLTEFGSTRNTLGELSWRQQKKFTATATIIEEYCNTHTPFNTLLHTYTDVQTHTHCIWAYSYTYQMTSMLNNRIVVLN